MSDFTSEFWSWFVAGVSVIGILGCLWLIKWMNKNPPSSKNVEATGHVWDEDLQELNNPLPSWWLNMFYLTLFFGVGYLVLYPGLGSFAGMLGWTQNGQYDTEVAKADATYGPLYDKFNNQSLKALGADPEAMKMGERLFTTYCTQCHGSDARGVPGFPNLTDNDWLWGGSPELIEQTISNGRNAAMPSWQASLGDEGVEQVANYVLSLSERQVDAKMAEAGKAKFTMFCVACHGPDGKGNQAMGAPNLTDNVWLYGGNKRTVMKTISGGRAGRMPAHGEFLGASKVHLLAAYIHSLSGE